MILHPYRPSFCSCGGRRGRHCLVLFVLECCSVSWVKLAARNENKHISLAFFLEYRHQLQSLYGGTKRQRKGKLALFVTAVAVKQRIVFFLPHKTAACLKIAYCSTVHKQRGRRLTLETESRWHYVSPVTCWEVWGEYSCLVVLKYAWLVIIRLWFSTENGGCVPHCSLWWRQSRSWYE